MINRRFVNGYTISTYKIGNVYETTVINKYGERIKARVDFTEEQARSTNNLFCGLCK